MNLLQVDSIQCYFFPAQDGEQDRRDALKRKLEQEKTKSKRKKKKLV